MALRHSNPTRPRYDKKNRIEQRARAPYNFVPLPEQVVTLAEGLPTHDRYHAGTHTGWIECEMETVSPTYVRGMLDLKTWKKHKGKQEEGQELTPEEKKAAAPFFSTGEEQVKDEGRGVPLIPGSSLRGMIRGLVEIAGYGRMRWVGNGPTFTFRAVAAAADDPLRDLYQSLLGRFGSNVRAGYLVCRREHGEEQWCVRPARSPSDLRLPSREAYLKVKEREIRSRELEGYLHFNSSHYKPQLHAVSFEVESRQDRQGRPYTAVTQIGKRGEYQHTGYLVCSGNMLETGEEGATRPAHQTSPRKNHALVLEENKRAKEVLIPQQVIRDYLDGLTPFQKDEVQKAWRAQAHADGDKPTMREGCLVEGLPVFYVEEQGVAGQSKVVAFGHSPNFRVPARVDIDPEKEKKLAEQGVKQRAATPRDFVPEDLQKGPHPDLADAIFGWVEEREWGPQQLSRAGRVFFTDARFERALGKVWYAEQPITPHVLGQPKPTTFQHYLVQDRDEGHDPDIKGTLAHYGSDPDSTQIRGHKLYWHKGENPNIAATAKEQKHDTQLTRIVPLRAGVRFRFKVHFENLHNEELGALLWALVLPGQAGTTYRHKLGMGKPLGMGAVHITPQLYLTDRVNRYEQLFQGEGWAEAASVAEMQPYLRAFEQFILREIGSNPEGSLADEERVRMLLAMLQWREGSDAWLDLTRYMEIERGTAAVNEYKERPVLPDPLAVTGESRAARPKPAAVGDAGPVTAAAPRQPPRQTPAGVSSAKPTDRLRPEPSQRLPDSDPVPDKSQAQAAPAAAVSDEAQAFAAFLAASAAEREAKEAQRQQAKAGKKKDKKRQ